MRRSCSLTNPNLSKATVLSKDPILSNHYALKEHDPDSYVTNTEMAASIKPFALPCCSCVQLPLLEQLGRSACEDESTSLNDTHH